MGQTKSRGGRLRRALVYTASLAGAWLLCSYVVAYALTRRPHPRHDEPPPTISWGTVESLRLTTGDGEELGAWFIDGRPDRPVVVLLHGHRGNRGDCLPQAELVAAEGCPVLLVTQRAHGDSTGEVNDIGYSARHDAIAAVEWIEKRRPGRAVVLWGQSMGAAAVTFAAPQLGTRIHGCILECPYRDLYTAVWNRTSLALPVPFNAVSYCGLRVVAPLVLADVDKIAPVDAAARMPSHLPVLILAGGRDRRACPHEASAIAEVLGGRAELAIVEQADHMALMRTDPEGYRRAVTRFLAGR